MEHPKTILLGHRRAGTTLLYSCFNNYHLDNTPNFVPVPGEINVPNTTDGDNYKTLYDKLNIDRYKIRVHDKQEMGKLFLKILNLDTFFIKYFPYVMDDFVPLNSIISKLNTRNINVNFLYRKNLLEGLLSLIISRWTNKWHSFEVESSPIVYDDIIYSNNELEFLINNYCIELKKCYNVYYKLASIGKISSVYEYEYDIKLNNFPYSSHNQYYKKMNTNSNKNIVMKNHPLLEDIFTQHLKNQRIQTNSSFELTLKF